MFNILIGGAAGQGIETMAAVLQKFLKDSGLYVFTTRDFMSRVRGGHNFTLIRFGAEQVLSHSDILDGIIAFDEDSLVLHSKSLKPDGFILCDSQWKDKDQRIIPLDLLGIAKELGNARTIGSIATGVILKLFDLEPVHIEDTLRKYIKKQYLEENRNALLRGYGLVGKRYSLPAGEPGERIIISGNQALAFGAIAGGIRFYSAYPMSPSTTILEYLSSKATEADIVVEQAEDEIAAINMAIGAAFAGAPAMTGTSGGGFCLKVEALGLSGMAEIPLVVADIQRPGPATGLPTRTEQSDLKFVISASHGEFPRLVIALRSHRDAFYQTARAFYLARKYQIPVIILSDQYLADSYASIEPYELDGVQPAQELEAVVEEGTYLRYRITEDGISPLLVPGKTKNFVTSDSDEHDERGWITESAEVRNQMMEKRLRKLIKLKEELQEPEFVGEDTYETLFLGWGSTYGPITEAVNRLNRETSGKYAALLFGDIYPLPEKLLKEKAPRAKRIINIEQNATGQLAELIREKTGIVCDDSLLKYDGRQMSSDEIISYTRKGVKL
ncbi:MAG TPA: 2-oxoacid:acceptor oxidoreductase subunit alpha [Clostridiales bacterium]|nr:2-oxoacid:acceptor oxidoreductase subunit alpha [Clostridiales bacterium]